MSRPSLTGARQSTALLAAAACLALTAAVPAHADATEPTLPVPSVGYRPAQTSPDVPAELLAVPRTGSAESYLADAPEPTPSGTPAGGAAARSLAVGATGSISGTITGLVAGSDVPIAGAIVYAMQW